MEETLRRHIGGPRPGAVVGLSPAEIAATIREQAAANAENGTDE